MSASGYSTVKALMVQYLPPLNQCRPCAAIADRHQVNLSGSVRKRQRPMDRARGNDPVQNDYVGAFKSMGQARRERMNRDRN